ncbi:MAG: L-aspartate oxidase [Acidobacteria bacterium]|nr:L-aspartate oxidase [Acidobacteriota bacterium]
MNVGGDFLVIGSGIAGLRAALSLAEAGDVVILTKADRSESNTGYAQGGIAAAMGPDDSPELHARDTLAAGDGLCVPEAVDILVHEGPRYVGELLDWGAAFDRAPDGQPALGREGAHSVRRVLHARDATGREIARLLWSRASTHPRIRVIDDALATDLVVTGGVCTGATFVTSGDTRGTASGGRTLLATGGAGQVFRETTNPAVATGDGIAMAARAGARIIDLEFVQFHPTVLSVPGAPRFLLSEALRGEGARLVNTAGEAFVERYEPAGDLASRDLVSRAIVREIERTGSAVYLSLAHLDQAFVRQRFPTIARACAQVGLDLARDPVPVSPAAHYVMGGVETDLNGETSLPSLFAAGEVACTGVHGANRLASNSLLEGLVFGARAAQVMTGASPSSSAPRHGGVASGSDGVTTRAAAAGTAAARTAATGTAIARAGVATAVGAPSVVASSDAAAAVLGARPISARGTIPTAGQVRDLMWRQVGVLRDGQSLERAVAQLEAWARALQRCRSSDGDESERRRIGNIVTTGLLMARAAWCRTESRGTHFREDFPARDDLHWNTRITDCLHVD